MRALTDNELDLVSGGDPNELTQQASYWGGQNGLSGWGVQNNTGGQNTVGQSLSVDGVTLTAGTFNIGGVSGSDILGTYNGESVGVGILNNDQAVLIYQGNMNGVTYGAAYNTQTSNFAAQATYSGHEWSGTIQYNSNGTVGMNVKVQF